MKRYTPAARVWVVVVTAAALVATVLSLWSGQPGLGDFAALVVLGVCAAVVHNFPIRSAFTGSTHHLTNVFVLAGAVVIAPAMLTLLPIIAITPYAIRRRRPGAFVGWMFNVAQTTLAVHAAAFLVRTTGSGGFSSPTAVVLLISAALAFTVVQALLVGIIIALSTRVSLRQTGTFSIEALQGEGLNDTLGLVVAGLWISNPLLLVFLAPVLVLAYRMTRTAHLAHLAEVDTKTGLHNSRHFERTLEEELGHSNRLNRPLAVLFADLDHFKRVNDAHGHAAGDQILREVATRLRGTLRKGDVVARFGGEEFVALLPGTDAEEAMYLAERVRAAVADSPFTLTDGAAVRCTISLGVATFPHDAVELSELLKQADLAMYRAKQTRNAVARGYALPAAPPQPATGEQASPPPPSQTSPARPTTPPRSPLAKNVLWCTNGLGFAVLVASSAALIAVGEWAGIIPLLALAVIAEYLEVRVYEANRAERISFSFTVGVTMAAVTMAPAAAPLVSAVAAVVHLWTIRQRQWDKALFNIANPALAAATAAALYTLLRPESHGFSPGHLGAALVAVAAFHLVNFGMISLMISLHTGRPLWAVVRASSWYAPTKMLLGLTGAFVGADAADLGWLGILMFLAPVLIMRFTLAFHARVSQRTIETLQAAKTEVEQAHEEKEETLRGLILTMASVIDAREPWVLGHSERVAKYTVAIGQVMGLSASELALVHTGGLLHDLGKVGIPESILNKPDRLTTEEYEVMQQHAMIGERILADVKPLAAVTRIVGEHHERIDGTGYPRGKKGDAISLGGRIVAVADALDAILSHRPYSEARSLEWAMEEMDRCAGAHFDAGVVAALKQLVADRGPGFFEGSSQTGEASRCCDTWMAQLTHTHAA